MIASYLRVEDKSCQFKLVYSLQGIRTLQTKWHHKPSAIRRVILEARINFILNSKEKRSNLTWSKSMPTNLVYLFMIWVLSNSMHSIVSSSRGYLLSLLFDFCSLISSCDC